MDEEKVTPNETPDLNVENNNLNVNEEISKADFILQKIKKRNEERNAVSDSDKKEDVIVEEDTTDAVTINKNETEKDKSSSDIKIEDEKEILSSVIDNTDEEEKEIAIIDVSELTIEELYNALSDIIKKGDFINSIRQVNAIKEEFNFKVAKNIEELKNKFISDGGDEKDFDETKTEIEDKFSLLLNDFYAKRNEHKEKEEQEKKKNLVLKYEIIEGISNLINKPESFETTFNNFKSLQQKWREVGLVPKNDVKQLWDDYHREVEKFYKYLEINKLLRDLDLKKNLDDKINLCEKAEELLTYEDISDARKQLQTLHELWKETGPVSKEKKDEIWDRFKAATITINKNFQEHFDKIKEQQERNLESKEFLCQKAEEYSTNEYTSQKEWKEASVQVIKLQSLWKGIGYVPQNKNTEIYQRFRDACDVFFEKIRKFYAKTNEERDNNLQLKTDLCNQAESLQESTEWKRTTEIYKNLQNEWKKIGPVSQKYSDAIWQRFRKACNIFFDRKKEYFSSRRKNESENYELKKALIEEVKNYQVTNTPEDLETLKEFQKRWTVIGFVPFEYKDLIYEEYRAAINTHFEKLNIDKRKQEELRFNEKIENIKSSRNPEELLNSEVIKLQNRIEKIENDIKIWENNLGFFANTKNAEPMINDFNKKISNSKKEVESLKNQIKQIRKAE